MPEELSGGGICNGHREMVLAAMERNKKRDSLFFGSLGQVHENKQLM